MELRYRSKIDPSLNMNRDSASIDKENSVRRKLRGIGPDNNNKNNNNKSSSFFGFHHRPPPIEHHHYVQQQQQSSSLPHVTVRSQFQPRSLGESRHNQNNHRNYYYDLESPRSSAVITGNPSSMVFPSQSHFSPQSPEMQMIYHKDTTIHHPSSSSNNNNNNYCIDDHHDANQQFREGSSSSSGTHSRMDHCSNPVALTLLQNAEMDEMQEEWDHCLSLSTTFTLSSSSSSDPLDVPSPPSHLRSHLETQVYPSGTTLIRPNAIRAPFSW